MKEKIRTLLLLLVTLISGSAMAAPLRWVCNGSSTKEGEWLSITHTSNNPNWYSGMTLLIDGASTPSSKALKMQSDTKIIINLTKKANVTIGVTTKNNNAINAANAKIKFDGTASESILEEDQKASTGVYTSKEITYTNVAAGEHTITRNSSELGVYYVKVDYDLNDQAYTVTLQQNGTTNLTETAANAGITLPGLKGNTTLSTTNDWNASSQVLYSQPCPSSNEYWEAYSNPSTVFPTGNVTTQTLNDVPNGVYEISLSAAASYANRTLGHTGAMAAGDYYIQNVRSGLYLSGANTWGTRGTLSMQGDLFTAAADGASWTFADKDLSVSYNKLKTDLFVDGAEAAKFTVEEVGGQNGVYTIKLGDAYLCQAETEGMHIGYELGTTASVTDAAKWRFLTREDAIKMLIGATAANPRPASFLLGNAGFNRNHSNASWTTEHNGGNFTISGTSGEITGTDNFISEAYHTSFNCSQELTGLPNGKYRVTAQAAVSGTGEDLPYVYANDKNTTFAAMANSESSMKAVGESFKQGLYNVTVDVTVTDGTLRVGFAGTRKDIWATWDNMNIEYLGGEPTEVFAGDKSMLIPAVERSSVPADAGITTSTFRVNVTDGQMTYGLRNVGGTFNPNWYIIKVNSITKLDNTEGLLGWYDNDGNKVGDAGETIYPEADMDLKAKYEYTLKSVIKTAGTELETVNGEAFDGAPIGFHRYQTKDGKLYEAANNSTGPYYGTYLYGPETITKEYTLVNDKGGQTIDGTEKKVVFLAEAETIPGFGFNQRSGVDIRCSGMAGGDVRNSPAVVTSLPNGEYMIYAGVRGGQPKREFTYQLFADDNELTLSNATVKGDSKNELWTSEPITLNAKTTDIKAGVAAGNDVWDYFIIVKTGDAVVECPHNIYEGDVIGETDNSSAWWGAHSKQFEINKGNSRTFTFHSHNFTEATNSWERNWAVLVTNILGHNGDNGWTGSEIFRVSGSGSNWGAGASYLKMYRGSEEIAIGGDERFVQDMKEGSSENTISISYVGKRIYLQGKIRTHNGTVYTIHSTSNEIDKQLEEEKIQVVFAVASNHLTDFTATEEQGAYQVVSIPGIKDENDNVLGDATAAQGSVAITDAEGIAVPALTYVAHGTALTFTATAGSGYVFKNWANGQTDATRTMVYDHEGIVMYSYFMAAANALTVAKPADVTIEDGGQIELNAIAQWAGEAIPSTGATYTWQVTEIPNEEDIYTLDGGENLASANFTYTQNGRPGRWYYRVKVTYSGKTVTSDWAKLIVKGGVLDASAPVTVTMTPENRETLGYLRTDATNNRGGKIEGVQDPPYLTNGQSISVTEKGAIKFVVNARKGGGSGYGNYYVLVDDELVQSVNVPYSTTATTEAIEIIPHAGADLNASHVVKIVSTATGSDLTIQYIQFFNTNDAELKTTFAEVKMRQPQTIAIESFSPGAITMQPVSSEFFDAEYNDGQLTLTPKKPGQGVIKFDIAEASTAGFNANTVDFNVTVRKQNITMAFTPDSYSWNKIEQPDNEPTFVNPVLVIKDEDGNIITDYEFVGIDYGSTDESLVYVNNGAVVVETELSQGDASLTASWGGDANYNKPADAVYRVNIVQGISFKTALYNKTTKDGVYNVGQKGYLKENVGEPNEKTLVTFTYGGWSIKDDKNNIIHKYPQNTEYTDKSWNRPAYTEEEGYTKAEIEADKKRIWIEDAWKNGTQEDAVLFPPVDPGFDYHTSGAQNAKSESYPVGGNFKTNDIFTLPVRGAYMTFEPTVNGTLSVYILQNGCLSGLSDYPNDAAKEGEFSPRAFFVVDGEGHNVEDYTSFEIKTNQTINLRYYTEAQKGNKIGTGAPYYLVTDPSDPAYNSRLNIATWASFKSQSARDQAAYAAAWNTGVGGTQKMVRLENGAYSAIQKGMVKYTFYVAAGQTYYIFANGSKMGFVGCNFVKDNPTKQPAQTLALSENVRYAPESLESDLAALSVPMYETVTLDRSFTAGNWNTICLPFTMTEDEVVENFGAGTELIILDKVNVEGDKATIHFTYHEIQSIVAGFPYLIKPTQACPNIEVHNKIINPDTKLTVFEDNGYTSKGIDGFCTANISNGKGTDTYSHLLKAGDIFLSSNKLYISKGASYLKGYRAYIDAPEGAQVASISFEYNNAWDDEDELPTAIGIAEMDPEMISTFSDMMQGVYNLKGQKVSDSTEGLPKGIYIVNGQKLTVE